MANLLAMETSGAICSVCLEVDGTRFLISEHVARGHNERLLPMLSEVCADAGLSVAQLRTSVDAIAFGCGPGSFTGVRIAAAAAQALALASGARVLRVASSAALARKAATGAPDAEGVITLIRSRRDLFYLATYRRDGTELSVAEPDRLRESSPTRRWYEQHGLWTAVGETPSWWQGAPVAADGADAGHVLDIGLRMLAAGKDVDAEEGLPLYLSGDSPWQKIG